MNQIDIPAGDGTPSLKRINQGWIKMGQELLLAVQEQRDSFSSGVRALAESIMFEGAEPGQRANASANVMLTLKDILENNFGAAVDLALSQRTTGGNGAYAALAIRYNGQTAELLFSNQPPYATIEPGNLGAGPPPAQPKKQQPQAPNWGDWDEQQGFSRQDVAQQQQNWNNSAYPPQEPTTLRAPQYQQPPQQQPAIPARFRGGKEELKRASPYDKPRLKRQLPPAQVDVQTVPFGQGAGPGHNNWSAPPQFKQNSGPHFGSRDMWKQADAAQPPMQKPLDPDAYFRNRMNQ